MLLRCRRRRRRDGLGGTATSGAGAGSGNEVVRLVRVVGIAGIRIVLGIDGAVEVDVGGAVSIGVRFGFRIGGSVGLMPARSRRVDSTWSSGRACAARPASGSAAAPAARARR